jgi:transcriptional regulator with GAF, ATPase, and Fis domain/pSer/pThr/pTyr-binding forkhead associated (FHA) protein
MISSRAPMKPRLIGVAGPLQGAVFALAEGRVTIGRDSTNEIWAADSFLSRRHCSLQSSGTESTIQDLGSHNGTRVNGIPIKEQKLAHGDQISVGDSLLVFLSDEDDAAHLTNPVEFEDTAEFQGLPVELSHEGAVYLQPDKLFAGFPETARTARDLNALLRLATKIGGIRSREALQWQLLGFIFDVVPAERGAVMFFDGSGEISSTAAWDRVGGPRHVVPINHSLVKRAFHERAAFLESGLPDDPARWEKGQQPMRSVLCVPLLGSQKALGAIYLEGASPTERLDKNHLQVASAVAGIAALALDNLRDFELLKQENQFLRAEANWEHNMVGESARMKEVFEFVRRVAPADSTVLIQGESGTGKELVARAIHRNSPRAELPFVAVNCAAITETLLESELFGHEKGAFTGAIAQKKGKMELANGGTLFLDEIGELAPGLQAKLLRVLQEREFERVGGTRPIPLDIRLVSATNCNLPEAIESGSFRRDLYYRLNVVGVSMPALRERREDILRLAEHFIAQSARKRNSRVRAISSQAQAYLANYDWPGNVRELENAIERALVLGSGDTLLPDDLPEAILEGGAPMLDPGAKYHGAIKESKKQLVLQALQQTNGSYIEAAKVLGIHPNSLLRLIRNLKIKTEAKAAQ